MEAQTHIGRRALIAGGGAVALTAALPASKAAADFDQHGHHGHHGGRCDLIPKGAAPKPIPGGVDSGDPNVGFINWWLPGPTDATTPILGLGGFGLDVDPSTITDFEGVSAMAVVAGTVRDGDGNPFDCEFDVRAMKGRYVGTDGVERKGAFAFL